MSKSCRTRKSARSRAWRRGPSSRVGIDRAWRLKNTWTSTRADRHGSPTGIGSVHRLRGRHAGGRAEGRAGKALARLHPVPHRARGFPARAGIAGPAQAGGAAQLPAGDPEPDLHALARAFLRPALEAVRADPVRMGVAADDRRDADLLHRALARSALGRAPRALIRPQST